MRGSAAAVLQKIFMVLPKVKEMGILLGSGKCVRINKLVLKIIFSFEGKFR